MLAPEPVHRDVGPTAQVDLHEGPAAVVDRHEGEHRRPDHRFDGELPEVREVGSDLVIHLGHVAFGQGEQHVFLVGEVLIERGDRHSGRGGDVASGQRLDPLGDHEPGSLVEDLLDAAPAPSLRRHSAQDRAAGSFGGHDLAV